MLSFVLVRETGLEPVRCNHTPLKRARLPVPPLSRIAVLDNDTIILHFGDMSICFLKIFKKIFFRYSSYNFAYISI